MFSPSSSQAKPQEIIAKNDLSSLQAYFSSQKPDKSLINSLLIFSVKNCSMANDTKEIIDFLISHGAQPKLSKDSEGKTPLMLAAEKGYIELVETLLSCKPDVNQKDSHDKTALYYAIDNKDNAENVDIVSILAEKTEASSINAFTDEFRNPLIKACEKGFEDSVRILLRKSADPNLAIKNQDTALHVAVKRKNLKICELLINSGADFCAKNKESLTALELASKDRDVFYEKICEIVEKYKEKSSVPKESCTKEKKENPNNNKFFDEFQKTIPKNLSVENLANNGNLQNFSRENMNKSQHLMDTYGNYALYHAKNKGNSEENLENFELKYFR